MNKKLIIIITVVLLAVFGLVFGLNQDTMGNFNETSYTGSLEGTEVDINSKIPGRVLKLYVSEGEEVKAGQVIAKISDEELQAKKAQAQALVEAAKAQLDQAKLAVTIQDQVNQANVFKAGGAYKAAQAQLNKARNGARAQEIAQAQANYELWVKTSKRVHELYSKGAVPAQKVDEVDTQLKVAAQTLNMAKEGARSEDIAAAAGLAEQAMAGVEQANAGLLQTSIAKMNVAAAEAKHEQALAGLREVAAYLKDTVVKAPVDGVVTVTYTDPGELISTGMPIASVTADNDLWVQVKVRETELAGVSLHRKVRVELAAGGTAEGEVVWINKKPDFAAKRATGERDDKDVLAYGVKIKLSSQPENAVIGETVRVKFQQ